MVKVIHYRSRLQDNYLVTSQYYEKNVELLTQYYIITIITMCQAFNVSLHKQSYYNNYPIKTKFVSRKLKTGGINNNKVVYLKPNASKGDYRSLKLATMNTIH